MICLGFSTSTDQGSVALSLKGKIYSLGSWTRREQASEALTARIKTGLKKHKIDFKAIDLIAVDKGPGSFTGARVSVNVAKTMAYTLGCPIFAESSLSIMAYGATAKEGQIFSLLDAHRSLFYFCAYDILAGTVKPLTKESALLLSKIIESAPSNGKLIVLSNLENSVITEFKNSLRTQYPDLEVKLSTLKDSVPKAQNLVEMATHAAPTTFTTWQALEPSYIRAPDAVEKFGKTI